MSASKTTIDKNTIKKWAEERNGKPAVVESTQDNGQGGGLLRIKFSKESDDELKEISWDEFFKIFENNDLAFLYQEEKNGNDSRFFKFVER